MKNCFILTLLITSSAAVSLAASAKAPAVTLVVRAEPKTGRLVRRVVSSNYSAAAKSTATPPSSPTAKSAAPALQNLADQIAQRHNIDRDLVHSVIRVESNYNPLAVSSKGALGLMQLIPSTARRFGVSNSFDPGENLEGGIRYLKYLLDQYGGDHLLALAAYNAGEAAVARYRGVPPFPETLGYVLQVEKSLSSSKEARKKQTSVSRSPTTTADGYNPIRIFNDAMGRVYYRTP
ncbi:MAG TPA: lytic transglycosylase domain-containing protein [Bryobacteraceae bacterium]|nr:lytic transglycosylase domain-containing protein [Bryobacteraceae bacterium]